MVAQRNPSAILHGLQDLRRGGFDVRRSRRPRESGLRGTRTRFPRWNAPQSGSCCSSRDVPLPRPKSHDPYPGSLFLPERMRAPLARGGPEILTDTKRSHGKEGFVLLRQREPLRSRQRRRRTPSSRPGSVRPPIRLNTSTGEGPAVVVGSSRGSEPSHGTCVAPGSDTQVEPSGTGFRGHNPSARQHGGVETTGSRTCNPHPSGAAVAAPGTFRAGPRPTAADPADLSRKGMSTPPSTSLRSGSSPRDSKRGPLGRAPLRNRVRERPDSALPQTGSITWFLLGQPAAGGSLP